MAGSTSAAAVAAYRKSSTTTSPTPVALAGAAAKGAEALDLGTLAIRFGQAAGFVGVGVLAGAFWLLGTGPAGTGSEIRVNPNEAAKGKTNVTGGEKAPAAEGAAAAGSVVKPIDEERAAHILGGDKTGGGHRSGTGKPGKSEFPPGWSDKKILGDIADVASDPNSVREAGRRGATIVRGTRDGIDIEVIVDPNGRILTGYPTNVPRNPGK